MKKVLSLFLVWVMVLTLIPLSSVMTSAETLSGTTGDCTWTLVDGVLTISGNGAMEDYPKGANYEYYEEPPCVGPWGAAITEVIIEDGVTSIGEYAFQSCRKLKKVSIAESVTRIGREAFTCTDTWDGDSVGLYIDNCLIDPFVLDEAYQIKEGTRLIADYTFGGAIREIKIPNSVKHIGKGAFGWCQYLEQIVIPDGVTEIRDDTFRECRGLKEIELFNSVTSIGEKAFYNCLNLHVVKYNGSSIDRLSLSIQKNNSDLTNAKWVYKVKEELKQEADGKYYYYVDDIKTAKTGLALVADEIHYIKNGIWQNELTTLVTSGGKGYYIKNGKWCKDTTLVKYSGKQFYVKNGIADFDFSGKVKIDNKTYKIKDGKVVANSKSETTSKTNNTSKPAASNKIEAETESDSLTEQETPARQQSTKNESDNNKEKTYMRVIVVLVTIIAIMILCGGAIVLYFKGKRN